MFVRVVSAYHRRRERHRGIAGGQTGAVTAIQRVGSFANGNLHFHTLSEMIRRCLAPLVLNLSCWPSAAGLARRGRDQFARWTEPG